MSLYIGQVDLLHLADLLGGLLQQTHATRLRFGRTSLPSLAKKAAAARGCRRDAVGRSVPEWPGGGEQADWPVSNSDTEFGTWFGR